MNVLEIQEILERQALYGWDEHDQITVVVEVQRLLVEIDRLNVLVGKMREARRALRGQHHNFTYAGALDQMFRALDDYEAAVKE